MPLPAISPAGVFTPFGYNPYSQAGFGPIPQLKQLPGSINTPIFTEPNSIITGSELQLWMILTGASPYWGGCNVYSALSATGTYTQIGTVFRGSVQGVLTAAFPSGSDPDTTDTLSVDVTMSQGTIIAGTDSDADAATTLCYCDGEYIAYSAATLTSSYNYNLDTYIRRGLFGTTISSHAIGSNFGLLTGNTFRQPYPQSYVGDTFYFKFPSFNTMYSNLEDLAAVPYYSFTLVGTGLQNPWFQSFSVSNHFTDMLPDPWDNNYEIFSVDAPVGIVFLENFSGSPTPVCKIAPTADVTLTIQSIHAGVPTTRGTLTFSSGSTTGTFTSSAFTLVEGDQIRMYAPAGVNSVMAGLSGTISGTQVP